MNGDFMITYNVFTKNKAEDVLLLQNEWFYENNTFGFISDTIDNIKNYPSEYFYLAENENKIIGYITAEIICDNEYNVFPPKSKYLCINDLYVSKNHRNCGIGEKLLSMIEEKAAASGIKNILISSSAKDAESVRRFYTRNGYGIWTTLYYKRTDWDVKTYNLEELNGYRYVVIFARYKNKWLYSKHKERDTWETAGGHIEIGETPLEAAKRELYEETGALKFDITAAFDYSVYSNSDFSNGQVFFAQIHELGDIPDYETQMCEVMTFDAIPDKITYEKILPCLYNRIQDWLNVQMNRDELWDIYDINRNLTGRTQKRGDPFKDGDYHLVVHVWVVNIKNEFLITRRAPNKGYPYMWECTGGSALSGDESITAAIREVYEETGLKLNKENGSCIMTLSRNNDFCDVWLFYQDFNISDVVLQENETIDAKWASKDEIFRMIDKNEFIPFHYINELFDKIL